MIDKTNVIVARGRSVVAIDPTTGLRRQFLAGEILPCCADEAEELITKGFARDPAKPEEARYPAEGWTNVADWGAAPGVATAYCTGPKI